MSRMTTLCILSLYVLWEITCYVYRQHILVGIGDQTSVSNA